ncbi:MAG TPA: 23S rRNA (adenine(2503)-C(2))-methyltransferase RlmN [bacterium]|nr:23S rRNA (adenine(2503)-C(2))-methyltransferase RlmN [bacterium]HPR87088.1 23S rRNA (adenine(2503)-C(2))-methyltransferase RlmN [bacterium]
MKTHLVGMNRTDLELYAEALGEKKFRGRQLFSWIYTKQAGGFDRMSDIAKPLRQRLEEEAVLGWMDLAQKQVSAASGSVKYLFRLEDKALVEAVYIPEAGRRTLCISSQVGCALGCTFCATGALGFQRSLTAGEIVDQVLQAARDSGALPTNIVFMGMGEPLVNYEAVMAAAAVINAADGIAIGHRHIVISTVGITPAILRYADEGQPYRLAISLHSAIDEKRRQIVPIAARYPLPELINAVKYYARKARRRPTFEYVLLAGFNDGEEDAAALRQLATELPCKVNLIPFNPAIPGFNRPDDARVARFAAWLAPLHAPVSVRWSKGTDIDAACGQLAGQAQNNGLLWEEHHEKNV